MLWALAAVESTYGRDRQHRRVEPSYMPGGEEYRRSPQIRSLWARWGEEGASSYGAWQMMYATALDLGFAGPPEGLIPDEVLAPLVVAYVHRSGALVLADVADAYNSGNYRDVFRPLEYMAKVVVAYELGWNAGPTV